LTVKILDTFYINKNVYKALKEQSKKDSIIKLHKGYIQIEGYRFYKTKKMPRGGN
jgi:hypothetical protein